jgi:cyclic beta-1,2-glucan synthetase
VGAVLDPIVRRSGASVTCRRAGRPVDDLLGMAETGTAALALVDKYQSVRMADRAFDLAWTHSQVTAAPAQRHEAEAQLYGRLAGALVYADAARRAAPGVLRSNRRGQSGLWSYGISGDAPIVLLRIGDRSTSSWCGS